jgi:hypothetical protein
MASARAAFCSTIREPQSVRLPQVGEDQLDEAGRMSSEDPALGMGHERAPDRPIATIRCSSLYV